MDWVFLSKLVPLFLYPLSLSILFMMIAGACSVCGKNIASRAAMLAATVILFISSLPVTASALIRNLESGFVPVRASESARADAILILGGALALPQPPRADLELVDASDRIRYARQLYDSDRAGKIIIAGGNVFPQRDVRGEAFYIASLLEEWGVPARDILFEEHSRNTYENATRVKSLLESENLSTILLVTSAMHMRRAYAVFKKQGIDVIPAPTDIHVTESDVPRVLRWIPSAHSLSATTWALKEYLGWWYYRLRGYV